MKLPKYALTIAGTVAATLAVVVLVVNLGLGDKQIDRRLQHLYAVADPQFQRTMGVMLGPSLVDGNRVDALLNGNEIFPAMLAAIRSAKETVTFETYIYWSGSIGEAFAAAFADRGAGPARAGPDLAPRVVVMCSCQAG